MMTKDKPFAFNNFVPKPIALRYCFVYSHHGHFVCDERAEKRTEKSDILPNWNIGNSDREHHAPNSAEKDTECKALANRVLLHSVQVRV